MFFSLFEHNLSSPLHIQNQLVDDVDGDCGGIDDYC